MFGSISCDVNSLRAEHDQYITKSNLSESTAESARKRLAKLGSTFLFCLVELGIFLALKAAESLSCDDKDSFLWGKLDLRAEIISRGFSLDAAKIFSYYMPSGHISNDLQANKDAGYITSKILSLVETLLSYRNINDLRCIIFVERVITAIVLQSLLNELLPRLTGWKTEYTAGNTSAMQPKSRKVQNKIVEEFRKGMVNIIVATSMLEEGLDVQSCNLVIRFDPSATVCSFIQSRGRARMQNTDFILMVRRWVCFVKSSTRPTLFLLWFSKHLSDGGVCCNTLLFQISLF